MAERPIIKLKKSTPIKEEQRGGFVKPKSNKEITLMKNKKKLFLNEIEHIETKGCVIIGANGSGKSRFSHSLAQLNNNNVTHIPAARYIYFNNGLQAKDLGSAQQEYENDEKPTSSFANSAINNFRSLLGLIQSDCIIFRKVAGHSNPRLQVIPIEDCR